MFNNPLSDEELPSISKELSDGGRLNHVENKPIFCNRLEKPIVLKPGQATFEDIKIHARLRQRLSEGTITRNTRYLRFMETHIMPVDLMNPSYENFIRHMDYREQIEHSGWGALKHEYQAMIMLLRCYGIDPKTWYYKPPQRQTNQMVTVPYPDQVHQLIHQRYSKDDYTNALIRYLFCHNFVIGWRPMSEVCIAKTTDVDLDNETLRIISPKMHNSIRTIRIHEIANQHDNPSMRNWLDVWRPKAVSQYSGDSLYVHPNGRPFTNPDQLRVFINRAVKQAQGTTIPTGYYNYLTRHWCAVARLIRTKLQTRKYDEYEVMEHLGHTKIETTIGYIRSTKFYYDQTGYDWLSSVLTDAPKKRVEESAVQPIKKSTKPMKHGLSTSPNRYKQVRRPPDSNYLTEGNQFDNIWFLVAVEKKQSVTLFLFFFNKNPSSFVMTNNSGVNMGANAWVFSHVFFIDSFPPEKIVTTQCPHPHTKTTTSDLLIGDND